MNEIFYVNVPTYKTYFANKLEKIAFINESIMIFLCFSIAAFSVCSVSCIAAVVCLAVGLAVSALILAIPYLERTPKITFTDTAIIHGIFKQTLPYSRIQKLIVGICPRKDSKTWAEHYGYYILGFDEKDKLCLSLSYQQKAWAILCDKCHDTATFIADKEQYEAYCEKKRALMKQLNIACGDVAVKEKYSGYVN